MIKTLVHKVDWISEKSGLVLRWLPVILILITVHEVARRYVFSAPTVWGYELSLMVGASLMLTWPYLLLHDIHPRVDALYRLLSVRGKAIVNSTCSLLIAFPLFIYVLIGSRRAMVRAFALGETMAESYWSPPAGPFRAMVFIAICFTLLELIPVFIRNLHQAVKGESYD